MTALRLVYGRGITDRVAVEEACAELAAHNAEALDLVDRARIHVRSIEWATRDIAPLHRHAVKLLVLLDGYARRHEPDDEPMEHAA